jgi:hypothetical protein
MLIEDLRYENSLGVSGPERMEKSESSYRKQEKYQSRVCPSTFDIESDISEDTDKSRTSPNRGISSERVLR